MSRGHTVLTSFLQGYGWLQVEMSPTSLTLIFGCRLWSCWDTGRITQPDIQSNIFSDLNFLLLLLYLWKPYLFSIFPANPLPQSELTAMAGRKWRGPYSSASYCRRVYLALSCIRPVFLCLFNSLSSSASPPLFSPSQLHPRCGCNFLVLCSFSYHTVVCKLIFNTILTGGKQLILMVGSSVVVGCVQFEMLWGDFETPQRNSLISSIPPIKIRSLVSFISLGQLPILMTLTVPCLTVSKSISLACIHLCSRLLKKPWLVT